MNIIVVVILMFTLTHTSCDRNEKLVINKIDHYYTISNQASNIYNLFTTTLGLPIAWEYKDWGWFKSGGISFGNVVLEVIDANANQNKVQYGIAFEPSISLRKSVVKLDSIKVDHGNINKTANWGTLSIKNHLSQELDLFFCDYYDKVGVAKSRKKDKDYIMNTKGSSLGIEYLQKIIIGISDPKLCKKDLLVFNGISLNENLLAFDYGPLLDFVQSDTFTFGQIIKVKNLKIAEKILVQHNLNYKIKQDSLVLNDEKIPLNIIFVDTK